MGDGMSDQQLIAYRALRGLHESTWRLFDGFAGVVMLGEPEMALRASIFQLETARKALDYAEKSVRAALQSIELEELMDGEECEGCGEPAVLMDDNLIPLCRSCADGCETEEFDA